MATASSLLSEDKFLCSVCLEVLTQPVSTPCGHNFCRECIHAYWDSSLICQCPFCKKTFASRPELQVNTTMSDLAAEVAKMVQVEALTLDPNPQERAAILCDICSETKHKAVKSCLVCLVCFCEAHLEPHHRVSVLKSHKLIEPISHFDEKLCQEHSKLTELYCQTDRAFICVMCLKTDHRRHNVIPVEEQYEAMMVKKDEVMADLQGMIHSTSDKIGQIENAIDVSQKEAEIEKQATVQVFDEFVRCVEKNKTELVEVIEERKRATKQKAEGFLKELRTELNELKSQSSELEQLSKSEDHHCFLLKFSTLRLSSKKDWTNMGVQSDMGFEAARRHMSQVNQKADEIMETIPEIKMRRRGEHADVTVEKAQKPLLIFQDKNQAVRECVLDVTVEKAQKPLLIFQDQKQVQKARADVTVAKAQKPLLIFQDKNQAVRERVVEVALDAGQNSLFMRPGRKQVVFGTEQDFLGVPISFKCPVKKKVKS